MFAGRVFCPDCVFFAGRVIGIDSGDANVLILKRFILNGDFNYERV